LKNKDVAREDESIQSEYDGDEDDGLSIDEDELEESRNFLNSS